MKNKKKLKKKGKLKNIKSLRELSLYRQNLKYKEKLYEKEVAGISEDIVDNFSDKLRDLTFNLTSRLFAQFFSKKKDT